MIDGRARLSGDLSPRVEAAFEEWANWSRARPMGGVTSPAWSMMEAKRIGVGSRSTWREPDMPDLVLAVDRAIARLDPPILGKVFSVYYLQSYPVELKAAICRMGPRRNPDVRKYYRLLKRARLAVADRLGAYFVIAA